MSDATTRGLRALLALLVLCNLLYFAWSRGALAAFGTEPARLREAEPQRLAEQIRPQLLHVGPAPSQDAAPPAASAPAVAPAASASSAAVTAAPQSISSATPAEAVPAAEPAAAAPPPQVEAPADPVTPTAAPAHGRRHRKRTPQDEPSSSP